MTPSIGDARAPAAPAPLLTVPRTVPNSPLPAPPPAIPTERVVVRSVGVPGWAVVALVALTATVASLGTLLALRMP